jgi:hypothetical protein
VSGVAGKRRLCFALLLAAVLLAAFPAQALAAGNDVGGNLAGLLRHYAGELYGGVVAIVSLFFLVHRRYTELAVFLLASVVVAWMVFAPGEIAHAAESIGRQILG